MRGPIWIMITVRVLSLCVFVVLLPHLNCVYVEAEALFSGSFVYRIPAIVYIPEYSLLITYAEKRLSVSDTGNIDIVSRISVDNGQTWSATQTVCDFGQDTCGNPTIVWDSVAKQIVLLVNRNKGTFALKDSSEEVRRHTYLIRGDIYHDSSNGDEPEFSLLNTDSGNTRSDSILRVQYSSPHSLDFFVAKKGWDAVGPGNGIVLRDGRLLFPALKRNVITNDHGVTWIVQHVAARVPDNNHGFSGGAGESAVVELSNGDLLRSDRADEPEFSNFKHWIYRRAFTRGMKQTDGAWLWGDYIHKTELIVPGHRCANCSDTAFTCDQCAAACSEKEHCTYKTPIQCQASMIRFDNTLLFLSPSSARDRDNLTLYQSLDEGNTWLFKQIIQKGRAGYSAMAQVGTHLAILYERKYPHRPMEIAFKFIELEH